MPLVQPITIPFEGKAENFIAESNRVIKQLEEVKAQTRAMGKEMEQQAKAADAAAKKNSLSWTDFRSAYQTVLDVVRVGVAVWEETGGKFVDNAIKVGNMARMMGVATEEASRLKEVADDVGISFESLAKSMKLAEKDGFLPNIEGLAQMSDEYLKLAPGVERAQFLLDRFGKSGDEMGKILERGGTAIRAMSAAIDDNMIVTNAAYLQARKYQISVDALSDSWDGFTYSVAPPLIDALTNITDGMQVFIKAITDSNPAHTTMAQSFAWATEEIAKEKLALLQTAEAAGTSGDAFVTEAEKVKALKDEMSDLNKANQDMLSLMNTLQSETDNFTSKNEDLKQKLIELQTEQAKYMAGGTKYKEIGKDIDGVKGDIEELAKAHEEASKKVLFDLITMKAASDGWQQGEFDNLVRMGVQWGVYDQTVADTAIELNKNAELIAAGLKKPLDAIMNINAKWMTLLSHSGDAVQLFVQVNTHGGQGGGAVSNHQYNPSTQTQQPYQAPAGTHAFGGSFTIPQNYVGESFGMPGGNTASGGERVTITPKSQDLIDYKKLSRAIVQAMAQAGG